MPKSPCKTTNRKQYNQSLIKSGSLVFGVDEEVMIGGRKANRSSVGGHTGSVI